MSAFGTTATSGTKTESCPGGSHPAILIGIIDLGTHLEEFDEMKNEKKTGRKVEKEVRKILLGWEIPGEFIAGKTPPATHVITKDYILSGHIKASLRKMMESWRGKPFADGENVDPTLGLGKACIVNIKEGKSAKGSTYANLDGVAPLIKGMAPPVGKRKTVTWTFADGAAALAAIDWLPAYLYGEKLSDMMARAKELRPAGSPPAKKPDAAPIADEPANVQADVPALGSTPDTIPF